MGIRMGVGLDGCYDGGVVWIGVRIGMWLGGC